MNDKLSKQLELLRRYKAKGWLDPNWKLLLDYTDELEEKSQLAIDKLELLLKDLKINSETEKQKGTSYFNTDLFAIRVNEIFKVLNESKEGKEKLWGKD